MQLYELRKDFQEALNNIEIDEETGEILYLQDFKGIQAEFTEKAESIALYIKSLSAEANALKVEADKLNNRKKTIENKADRLSEYLSRELLEANFKEIKTSKCIINFRKSSKVEITSEADISADFIELVETKKIDKNKIKKAIKSGQVVKGACIVECQNLQIK